MAIPMATTLEVPKIDTMSAFTQGAAAAEGVQNSQLARAKQGMEMIASASYGVLGNNLDGQADPAKWEQTLDFFEARGVPVKEFRGKPQMANVIARSSMDVLRASHDEKTFELALKKFEQDVATGTGDENFYAPIKGYDDKGNPIFVQPGNKGSSNVMDLPEGFNPQSRFEKVDLGTEWLITDTTTGEQKRIPKDIAGAAAQEEIGTAQGKAAAAAPADIAAGEMALGLIEQIRTHPEIDYATGQGAAWGMNDPRINPQRAAFQDLVEQVKSGAFLSAIGQLRGLGALSNAEGQTATAAVTRLNTFTDKASFLKALEDYETVVKLGVDRARRKIRVDENGNEAPAEGGPEPLAPDDDGVGDLNPAEMSDEELLQMLN